MTDHISDLFEELVAADADLKVKSDASQIARTAETSALNRVNKAQKAFDAAVSKLKAEAHWSTDWSAERKRAQCVDSR